MAKRFCDTSLWDKEWFQCLSLINKVFLKYIFENCDCAGVWEPNYRMASFIIGESVTEHNVEEINRINNLFEKLENGKIFINNFVNFQYGKLSEKCNPHKSIIKLLQKHGLYERVVNSYNTSDDEQEQIEVKELKPVEYCADSKEVTEFVQLYQKSKNENFRPSYQDRCKIAKVLTSESGLDKEYWQTVFLKAKQGWRIKEAGEEKRVKCPLDKILAEHSKIFCDEANLKPLPYNPIEKKKDEQQQNDYRKKLQELNPELAKHIEDLEYEVPK